MRLKFKQDQSLGVVVNLKSRKISEVNWLLDNLNKAFNNEQNSKQNIKILKIFSQILIIKN